MRVLSATELLGIWERGLTQPPVQRALGLLVAASPETSPAQLAELSIGQRDGLLMTLREWMFGSQIQSIATCPHCSDRLELAFNTSDIRVPVPTAEQHKVSLLSRLFRRNQKSNSQPCSFRFADYELQFRLPNSLDLVVCVAQIPALNSGTSDTTSPQRILLERCLLVAYHRGKKQSIEQLPADAIAAVVAQMAEIDPQANVQLNLTCPGCSHQWRSHFDIVSFFWSEIHAWAVRTLREIHVLASAYGWREADILAMNPYRRQLYLEMLGR